MKYVIKIFIYFQDLAHYPTFPHRKHTFKILRGWPKSRNQPILRESKIRSSEHIITKATILVKNLSEE